MMNFKFITKSILKQLMYFISLVTINLYAQGEEKKQLIPLIVDADTANEVDDLFAIVRAIKEPKFDLLGITSAQFNTSPLASENSVNESQEINEAILKLMKREEIAVPLGSNIPLLNAKTPSNSEASEFIIKMAHQASSDKKLNITVLGSCTNVASAILQDPSIIPKIKVHYIGFWHTIATNSYNKKEFNTKNDPIAVDVLLNTKNLDFNVMTATTCQHLVFEKTDVDLHLKGQSEIGDYLIDRWETYTRWWTKEDVEKKRWIMWDVAIIEALANPKLSKTKQFLTPKENTQRLIDIHTKIKAKKMTSSFWEHLNN